MNRSKMNILWSLIPGGIFPLILFIIITYLVPEVIRANEPFHAVLESTGLFAGLFMAFLLLLQIDEAKNNSHYIWIASSLIVMAILDGFHASVHPGNNFVWLHTIAMLSGAIIINIVWISKSRNRIINIRLIPSLAATAAIAIGIIALMFPDSQPVIVSEGNFTFTASALNVIAGILFIIASVFFILRYWANSELEEIMFSFFFLINGLAAILFPFGHMWHTEWWFWHFLRLAAYFVVLAFIFYIFQDFINRQRAEAELREKEAKFRTLVDNIPQKIFLKDRNYRWAAINKKLALDLGLQPDEIVGKLDSDLFPPDLAAKYHEDDLRIMGTGKTEDFEEKYIQDGKETWVQTVKTPVIDEKGNIIGVLGVFQDITEKKKNEEMLQRQRQELITKNRIAQVFLNMPDEEMYSEVLQVILEATGSKHGIFGYIDEDGALAVPTMRKSLWWDQCNIVNKDNRFPYETWGNGSWARTLRERKSNYSNDPSSLMPGGHIPVSRHISIPIVFRETAIGLIVIANSENDYNESDVALLEEIGNQIASSLIARLQRDREEKRRKEIEKEVRNTVEVLASSSSEIMTAASQVASGTAETSAAISETTTTVEEVRQAAQLSSEKARNVSDKAQRVDQVSQAGKKAVEETSSVMGHIREQMESIAQTIVRLSEQTQSIGGIIASVTDIADQSNLLAVNAAIEAARAGEQGKGFSVVAQEIRILAEQSKQATAQVRGILSDIQKATSVAVMATEQGSKSADAGVKQTVQTGEAIRVLVESSKEAAQTSTQIVASSQQQVVGMEQIGIAINNINQAGMDTVTGMRQVENSARDLNILGQKLKEMVEQFKG